MRRQIVFERFGSLKEWYSQTEVNFMCDVAAMELVKLDI